jgi:hypothetical protein
MPIKNQLSKNTRLETPTFGEILWPKKIRGLTARPNFYMFGSRPNFFYPLIGVHAYMRVISIFWGDR